MMRQKTLARLDAIAGKLAEAFAEDTERRFDAQRRDIESAYAKLGTKNEIAFFRHTLRKDSKVIPAGLRGAGLDVSDGEWSSVMKTPRQANYLANEICSRLKIRMWRDPAFGAVLRGAMGYAAKKTRPKYVQEELGL